ncbi:hypothetical protein TKK_0004115 [Trichogramma kaykai]
MKLFAKHELFDKSVDLEKCWYDDEVFVKRAKYNLENKEDCELYLCEKLSRRFFRRWALDPFMELIHYRLLILCCDMIVEELSNEDLYNTCVAATGQKL